MVSIVFRDFPTTHWLTEPSPPDHSKVTGSPALTESGVLVKPMMSWACAKASKHEAPRRRLREKYMALWKVMGKWNEGY